MPSYIENHKDKIPKNSSPLPSYMANDNSEGSLPTKTKFKSMSEQVGHASPWEKAESYPSGELPADMPKTHLGPREGEIQPTGWNPFEFIQAKLNEFLNNPKVKSPHHHRRRIVVEQTNIPSLNISEAKAAHVPHEIILGEELERSQTKIVAKFAKPSTDSTLEALRQVLEVIHDWDNGIETEPMKDSVFNKKRTKLDTAKRGRKKRDRNASPNDPLHYKQTLYIYGTFDYPGEIVIAVA